MEGVEAAEEQAESERADEKPLNERELDDSGDHRPGDLCRPGRVAAIFTITMSSVDLLAFDQHRPFRHDSLTGGQTLKNANLITGDIGHRYFALQVVIGRIDHVDEMLPVDLDDGLF